MGCAVTGDFPIHQCYYRPKRSFGQGNIFTSVCLSTGGGGACSKFSGGVPAPNFRGGVPAPNFGGGPPIFGIRSTFGRYASYWNAFLSYVKGFTEELRTRPYMITKRRCDQNITFLLDLIVWNKVISCFISWLFIMFLYTWNAPTKVSSFRINFRSVWVSLSKTQQVKRSWNR